MFLKIICYDMDYLLSIIAVCCRPYELQLQTWTFEVKFSVVLVGPGYPGYSTEGWCKAKASLGWST